jgi:S1-C subfamily serine protease
MTALTLAFLLLQGAQDPVDEALQQALAFEERINEVVEKVRPGYVFIGGGSGVCITKDGWVLTNHHVAGPTGRKWRVHFTGGKAYDATVIGHDKNGDISLLKIDTTDELPFVPLGDSDALKIGQHVIAVGNPFLLGNGKGATGGGRMRRSDGNWEPTITFGIVSALHRFQDWYMDAIHTDCQINPGNSGGPLINLKGEVIGINGRIAMRFFNRVNTGVGYAIPSNQIKHYMKAFKAGGRVWHGYIDGITVTNAGHEGYEDTGEYGDGALVVGVEEPSPASRAGFREGDIITNIAGQRVFNTNRMHGVLGTYPQTATVPVVVKRKSRGKWIEVKFDVWLGDPKKFTPPWKKKGNEGNDGDEEGNKKDEDND